MSYSNYVHLDFVEIVAETEKALLVKFQASDMDDEQEEWIPLSQIADPDDYHEGDRIGTISVTEWICKQKGLGDYERR